jgi:hypothetical protein
MALGHSYCLSWLLEEHLEMLVKLKKCGKKENMKMLMQKMTFSTPTTQLIKITDPISLQNHKNNQNLPINLKVIAYFHDIISCRVHHWITCWSSDLPFSGSTRHLILKEKMTALADSPVPS